MLLQLTTTGARSGVPRTVTVAYVEHAGRRLVFASHSDLAWLHDLRADPHVTVEVNDTRYDAIAEEITGAERDRLSVDEDDSRVIALTPARVGAATAQLKEIHAGLREQLSTALAAVDAYLAGAADAPRPMTTLHQHCLSFCSSLHAHHSREDGVFPRLAADFPELEPALDRLTREHLAVAAINEQLTATLDQLVVDPARAQDLRATLTRLSTDLEAHYAYEETHLGPALDAA
jgi:deazaflavin-dependent oxidoreductase (nitroreductase family)